MKDWMRALDKSSDLRHLIRRSLRLEGKSRWGCENNPCVALEIELALAVLALA